MAPDRITSVSPDPKGKVGKRQVVRRPHTARAVFLDRDGVLNRALVRDGKPFPPPSPDALEILEGVADACRLLKAAGYLLVVVTNQPDVARGTQTIENVREINARLSEEIPVDDIRVCYHDDPDACECRKPKPGLLLEAAAEWGIDLEASYMVGDRSKDIEAGMAAGCTTIFIDYGYHEELRIVPDLKTSSLKEAAEWIVQQQSTRVRRLR